MKNDGVTAGGRRAADDAVLFEVVGVWPLFPELIKNSTEHNNHYLSLVNIRGSVFVCTEYLVVYLYIQLKVFIQRLALR